MSALAQANQTQQSIFTLLHFERRWIIGAAWDFGESNPGRHQMKAVFH